MFIGSIVHILLIFTIYLFLSTIPRIAYVAMPHWFWTILKVNTKKIEQLSIKKFGPPTNKFLAPPLTLPYVLS